MNLIFKIERPDIDKYYDLFESTGWNEEYKLKKSDLAYSLANSYYSVCAYEGDILIGFGRIVSDGILHAMIYEMIIEPNYQRMGVGTKILNMLVEKCRKDNIRDIQLFCAYGKKPFYIKYGFTERDNEAPGMELKTPIPVNTAAVTESIIK